MRPLDIWALITLLMDGVAAMLLVPVTMCTGDVMLWRNKEDTQNRVIRIMYINVLLQRGTVRLIAGLMFLMTPQLLWPAIGTYAVEAVLLATLCACTDLVRTPLALMAVVLNLIEVGLLIAAVVT